MDCSTDEQDYSLRSQKTKVIVSVIYNQTHNVPMINHTIEGEIVSALVDIGSSISFISPDIFEN